MFGITLADLKAYLGYSPTDVTRDTQLELLLEAGYLALKQVLGRNLEFGIYRDTFRFIGPAHYVTEFPVFEAISVTVENTTLADLTGLDIFKQSGRFQIKNQHHASKTDNGTYVVVYAGGYATLPADIKLALFNAIQAADNAQKQSTDFGGPIKRLSVYDVGVADLAVSKDGTSNILFMHLTRDLELYSALSRSFGGWLINESEYVSPYYGSPQPGAPVPL